MVPGAGGSANGWLIDILGYLATDGGLRVETQLGVTPTDKQADTTTRHFRRGQQCKRRAELHNLG